MDLYDKDRRTVQFNNLHFDIAEDELHDICCPCGPIVELHIIARYASSDCGMQLLCYVLSIAVELTFCRTIQQSSLG